MTELEQSETVLKFFRDSWSVDIYNKHKKYFFKKGQFLLEDYQIRITY